MTTDFIHVLINFCSPCSSIREQPPHQSTNIIHC